MMHAFSPKTRLTVVTSAEEPHDPETETCLCLYEVSVVGRVPIELDSAPSKHSGYGDPTIIIPILETSQDSEVCAPSSVYSQAFTIMTAWSKNVSVKSAHASVLTNFLDFDCRILPIMGGVLYRTSLPKANQPPKTPSERLSTPVCGILDALSSPQVPPNTPPNMPTTPGGSSRPALSRPSTSASHDSDSASDTDSRASSRRSSRRKCQNRWSSLSPAVRFGAFNPRLTMPSIASTAVGGGKRTGLSLASLRSGTVSVAQMTGAAKIDLPYILQGIKSLGTLKGRWFIALQLGGNWGALRVGMGRGLEALTKASSMDSSEDASADQGSNETDQKKSSGQKESKVRYSDTESGEDDDESDSSESSSEEDIPTEAKNAIPDENDEDIYDEEGFDSFGELPSQLPDDSDFIGDLDAEEPPVASLRRRGAVDKGSNILANRRGGMDHGFVAESNRRGSVLKKSPTANLEALFSAISEQVMPEGNPRRALESRASSDTGAQVMRPIPGNGASSPTKRAPRGSWEGKETLRAVLAESRHISWYNITKWACQLTRSLQWCHSQYMVLGELSLDSVWLLSDNLVMSSARDAAKREPYDKNSIRAREMNLYMMIKGLGKRKRRVFRAQRKLALQARDAWIDPTPWISALTRKVDGLGPCLRHFPLLVKKDVSKNGSFFVADRKSDIADLTAELETFGKLQQRDLRQLGLLIVQMLLHRPLTEIESLRMRNADYDAVFGLVDILGRAPAPVKQILKTCFSAPQTVEQYIPPASAALRSTKAESISASVNLSLSLTRSYLEAKKALIEYVKQEQQDRNFVKQMHWTKADERQRVFLIEQRIKQLAKVARAGPKAARSRILADEKKLMFELLPLDQQQRMRRKEALYEVAKANIKRKRGLVRMANFRHRSKQEIRVWFRDAISACLKNAWGLKKPTLRDKGKRLDINQAQRVKECLGPLTQTVMFKLLTAVGVNCHALKAQGRGSTVGLTLQDTDQDMHTLIRAISHELATRLADRCTSGELADLLEEVQADAAQKMEKSSLASMLSAALFTIKKTSTEADFLNKAWDILQESVEDLADTIMMGEDEEAPSSPTTPQTGKRTESRGGSRQGARPSSPKPISAITPSRSPRGLRPLTGVSRPSTEQANPREPSSKRSRPGTSVNTRSGWIKAIKRMICIAVLERYDEQRWQRDSGRELAACKLQSLCRLIKVTNIMRRIWSKTRDIHMKLLQKEAKQIADEKLQRITSGEADAKDKASTDLLFPEKLVYPRLLTAYRPSREGDPSGRGIHTLDVLLSILFKQSNFGELFTEAGADMSRFLGVKAFLISEPSALSHSTSKKKIRDLASDVHGEVLLLVYDRRVAPQIVHKATNKLALQFYAHSQSQEDWSNAKRPPTLPAAIIALPPEPEEWTRENFAIKIQSQQDNYPFVAAEAFGAPNKLRVRVRGLRPNSSYRFRAFLSSDLTPRQLWDRVPQSYATMQRCVFFPTGADAAPTGQIVDAEIAKRLALFASEEWERRKMEKYEVESRRFYAVLECEQDIERLVGDGFLPENIPGSIIGNRLNVLVLQMRSAYKQAPEPTPLERLLVERSLPCGPTKLHLPIQLTSVSAITNPTLPHAPTVTLANLLLSEGEEGAGDEIIEDNERDGQREALESSIALQIPKESLSRVVKVRMATALVTLTWKDSPFDGGSRIDAFAVSRRLMFLEGTLRESTEVDNVAISSALWKSEWKVLVTRQFRRISSREHTDTILLPRALPLAALRAWHTVCEHESAVAAATRTSFSGATVSVYAQYRIRPRSRVGLGPYSLPFLVPLLSLVQPKIAPDLTVDVQEVLCQRLRFKAGSAEIGNTAIASGKRDLRTLMDTAGIGSALDRLKQRVDRSEMLMLQPLSDMQSDEGRKIVPAAIDTAATSVISRLKNVGEWMKRVRRDRDCNEGSTAVMPILKPNSSKVRPSRVAPLAGTNAPLFEKIPSLSATSPILSSVDRSNSSDKAWQMIDDLCTLPPSARNFMDLKEATSAPILRQWGYSQAVAEAVKEQKQEEVRDDEIGGKDIDLLIRKMQAQMQLFEQGERISSVLADTSTEAAAFTETMDKVWVHLKSKRQIN